MKKTLQIILSMSLIVSLLFVFFDKQIVEANTSHQEKEQPIQNTFYTTISQDGNVDVHYYDEEENQPVTLKSHSYQVVAKQSDEEEVVESYDSYEEAKNTIDDMKGFRRFSLKPTTYDVESVIDTKDIKYGVARIVGYITYKEYDGTSRGRTGYTHGTSANDAAYISTSSDNKTIRVKQAGIIMDVPAENIELSEYSSNSKVSYYLAKNGILYHYYYSGSYGSQPRLNSTQVGYTPKYLKENVKYYSYDGHYFYTTYTKMIDDYRSGVRYFANAVNKNQPYYNYYQYLSFRSQTNFKAKDFDQMVIHQKGEDTISKLKGQGQPLLNVEKKVGINASLMLGVAINESAWGMSRYSQDRNNLFGIGAVDSNPNKAMSFETVEDCFDYFSYNTISSGYMNGMDWRYRGPHLGDKQSGINVKYASDPYWGEKAASFSYILEKENKSAKDYEKYQIGISNAGKVDFYSQENLTKNIYDSTANDSTNSKVYNYPVTILNSTGDTYKILSDTVLNSQRTGNSPKSHFDINRDYVYIRKSAVQLRDGQTVNPVPEYKKGDVNGDNMITPADYVKIKNHIMGKTSLKDRSLRAADVNNDGDITPADYVKVKNMIMG